MEIDPQTTNRAVREILNQLVRQLPGYRWESICTFSDGRGRTIIELNLYRSGGSRRIARIAYQLETGAILNYSYRSDLGKAPDSVVDLLLDIANAERARILS